MGKHALKPLISDELALIPDEPVENFKGFLAINATQSH